MSGTTPKIRMRGVRKAFAGKHNSGGDELSVEPAHLFEELLVGHSSGFGAGSGLDHNHETHGRLSFSEKGFDQDTLALLK